MDEQEIRRDERRRVASFVDRDGEDLISFTGEDCGRLLELVVYLLMLDQQFTDADPMIKEAEEGYDPAALQRRNSRDLCGND